MNVTLKNGSQTLDITLPDNSDVGAIRAMRDELEELGVSGAYTFAINARGVEDAHALTDGDVISFRPKTGEKG
jgi:molybdopterin converting factor small subunit